MPTRRNCLKALGAALAAAPHDIVADQVVPDASDVVMFEGIGATQADARAPGVLDPAVLDRPMRTHMRSDRALLELRGARRAPILG